MPSDSVEPVVPGGSVRNADATHSPKLQLGRLETLQRWAQYGATVALVLTFASIVSASYVLASLNRERGAMETKLVTTNSELGKRETELTDKELQIKGKEATLTRLNEEIARRNAAITALDSRSEASVAPSTIPPRVYIQITDNAQRSGARDVAKQLEAQGFIVPGIENVAGKAATQSRSDLRFYGDDPAAPQDVKRIKTVLQREFSLVLKESRLPKSSRVRQRHYELWLGTDFSAH